MRRDVKLENIFIAGDGRVRLGDFGLTMSMKQELAISPVGTVEYMAPEVGRCAHKELLSMGFMGLPLLMKQSSVHAARHAA
jgi:serine/threonine protein kinase